MDAFDILWSWDKNHSTSHEIMIPIIYKKIKADYRKIAINWLKTL